MNRARRNSDMEAASPVHSVIKEKNNVATISTGRRPNLSANMLKSNEPTRMPTSAALSTGPI